MFPPTRPPIPPPPPPPKKNPRVCDVMQVNWLSVFQNLAWKCIIIYSSGEKIVFNVQMFFYVFACVDQTQDNVTRKINPLSMFCCSESINRGCTCTESKGRSFVLLRDPSCTPERAKVQSKKQKCTKWTLLRGLNTFVLRRGHIWMRLVLWKTFFLKNAWMKLGVDGNPWGELCAWCKDALGLFLRAAAARARAGECRGRACAEKTHGKRSVSVQLHTVLVKELNHMRGFPGPVSRSLARTSACTSSKLFQTKYLIISIHAFLI